jgi:hypothetical protein
MDWEISKLTIESWLTTIISCLSCIIPNRNVEALSTFDQVGMISLKNGFDVESNGNITLPLNFADCNAVVNESYPLRWKERSRWEKKLKEAIRWDGIDAYPTFVSRVSCLRTFPLLCFQLISAEGDSPDWEHKALLQIRDSELESNIAELNRLGAKISLLLHLIDRRMSN